MPRCTQCGGSGKALSKGSMNRAVCPCCHGSGKAQDPNINAELAQAVGGKYRGFQGPKTASWGQVNKTGTFPVYQQ